MSRELDEIEYVLGRVVKAKKQCVAGSVNVKLSRYLRRLLLERADVYREVEEQLSKAKERLLRPAAVIAEHCHAASDGECFSSTCPQLRDGEPAKSGRSCPLPRRKDE